MIRIIRLVIPSLTKRCFNNIMMKRSCINNGILTMFRQVPRIRNFLNIEENSNSNNEINNSLKKKIDNLDTIKGTVNYGEDGLYVLSCTCNICNQNITKKFSKKAYNQGIVIIRCEGCNNHHLISDKLGWFSDKNDENMDIFELLKNKEVTIS